MLLKLILLLTVLPLVELYLLVKLTYWTDSFAVTAAVIIGTGVVGAFLARLEGFRVLKKMRQELRRGQLPPGSILDGVMILVAGALLITPGLLTDALGFFLLMPPGRALVRRVLKRWLRKKIREGSIQFRSSGWHRGPPERPHTPQYWSKDEETEQD